MTVNFTVISLFDSEDKIDSSTFQAVFLESKVPTANLEQM
jgi:hypothetical protein